MRSSGLLLLASVTGVLAACAQGSELGDVGGNGGAGGVVGGSRGQGASSSGGGRATSSASSSGSGGGGGPGGAGGMGGSGGVGGATCDFTAPDACAGAAQIQSVNGDKGNDTRTETGNTSKWFELQVKEGVSSLINFPGLSYTVTLASPPGTSYGLFVHEGNSSGPSCGASAMTGTGTPATVTDKWSDTPTVDDTRWISIEVRHLSGDACGPTDLWTLTVDGHT